MSVEHNPKYIHHADPVDTSLIREGVFGLEDGMVSTLGAVTGIATATQDYFTVILAGCVVISVESIAMAVGSYLSSKSEKEIDERMLFEEKQEIAKFPQEEREELYEMYVQEEWPKELAHNMADAASANPKIMLQEMAYRELQIIPDNLERPLHNAVIMGISYVIGGSIPLIPYLFSRDISFILPISIGFTLVALFGLGALTTKFSKRSWWKAGLEMFALASAAAFIGYAVGQGIDKVFGLG
ncbi:MAG: hypothetical protein HN726_01980 [Candidatus Magasanikbacteria bacterium]|nr:hypothetical protein [Candidatus Magasanikbacteria bacterium]MBT4220981.1 hypothetical protein [Candidatus Magasanikbacteria bacterium]MBT4350499.1 hypothetical protein [Candidatus Magasanikbacteria bacterium]MBT4541948.1 hypothetical protein [Candidatus Magasanikbacteria bacterium]MBT6252886.1 hypothetical protein [Candidatus Magasanikbacteria bacterium]